MRMRLAALYCFDALGHFGCLAAQVGGVRLVKTFGSWE